jgi:molybdenum cofactor guanylyltransferase
MAEAAGIVLAGGRSTRMGTPKAALEWHGSTLLRRLTGIVARAVDRPVVVVRAPGQALPPLPDAVEVVEDAGEGRRPLQGLAADPETPLARGDTVSFMAAGAHPGNDAVAPATGRPVR